MDPNTRVEWPSKYTKRVG